ncbi:putative Type IV pilus biogenesis and competence protein PilQ [Candidatus Sulfobium mesophilum]|uniref:Putative Type IV pilus biogenesis and competence protein PilQ n=1 Tax=Candidatus Sulfobium mesophilum TaxID=2016548 RepID=A0A2U3QEN1_9BACT|nr:putative Type IV pilus biogenesis and competence protein PilQ [Candidatus Sulfobium mesophilum]
MKKILISKFLLSFILVTLVFGCATKARTKETAEADEFPVLADIKQQENGISFVGSKNFIYTIYTGNDPYKVTIDIPDMRLGNFKEKIVWDKAGISEILPRQLDTPKPSVRLDITLQSPAAVVPLYKDNTLTLLTKPEEPVTLTQEKTEEKVGSNETTDAAAAVSPPDPAAESKPSEAATPETKEGETAEIKSAAGGGAVLSEAKSIVRIELKKSAEALKVLIIGDGTMKPNVFPIDHRIVIDVPNVSMHASLPTSVVSPLKGIRTGKHRDKVRLVLDLREKTAFDVATIGNTIEVMLKSKERPAAVQSENKTVQNGTALKELPAKGAVQKEASHNGEQDAKAEGRYKGKKISLDFQDAEVGPIFRLLADVNDYNLVLDPAVKGKITIKLMNVPWDQALDIILNQTHLSYRIEGNILWIAPVTVFDQIANEKAKSKETEEKSEELVQEVLRVNYASAGEVQTAINNGKLLSARGTITPDARMNTLIIKDTQKSIEKIKELVKIMDLAKPQVMIEAKLVEVGTTYSESLGIRWGGNFSSQTFPNNLGGNFSVNTPTVTAGPATSNAGGAMNLTLGHANSMSVNMSLSALESIGKSKTLSNPKVLTMDNEAATIQQGTTFFIPTVSQSGTQTQSQTATLSLSVTPKITPDGYIQLKVNATDNSLQPGTAGATAVVNTKSLTTQALVKNGETLVIGGIYRLDDSESSDAVPVLGRIPGLGWLFKTKDRIGPNIKELLIFITPIIVSQPI